MPILANLSMKVRAAGRDQRMTEGEKCSADPSRLRNMQSDHPHCLI